MDMERETEGKWEEGRNRVRGRGVNVDSFPLQKH